MGLLLTALLVLCLSCVCMQASGVPSVVSGATAQEAETATKVESPQSDTVSGVNVKAVLDEFIGRMDATLLRIQTNTATTVDAGGDVRIGDRAVAIILASGLALAVLTYPVWRLVWRRRDGTWRATQR